MAIYSKESLEALRQKIDLVDLLSSHLDLKKFGASYKTLCPFHDEKTPSFTIQRGDSHYHCFGCGAHGDAIAFLMSHLRLSFGEAVENLAQRFHITLEKVEGETNKGPNKAKLKEALEYSSRFYHFSLLHTTEGHEAIRYLFERGIDLDFIRQFQIGIAPRAPGVLRGVLHAKFISDEVMAEAGLLVPDQKGGWRDFFYDRITFPICDAASNVIGFSARKFKEGTTGGKYVNTQETALFKKSKILFGLNYSRRRIAKERKAIIVEGQIDALRLIQQGLNMTVAGQGTAFGEGHVKELTSLGLSQAYLALDSDIAGQEAAVKIGHLFQKEGVEVNIVSLPEGSDPDQFVRTNGIEQFVKLLEESEDYLSFLVKHESKKINIDSPAGKNEIVKNISQKIREWNQELVVHESLRRLAFLTQTPESVILHDSVFTPNVYIKKTASAGSISIDPDQIMETDFLRWLVFFGGAYPNFIEMAKANVDVTTLKVPVCQKIYSNVLDKYSCNSKIDLLSLSDCLAREEEQTVLDELMHKKISKEKVEGQYVVAIQKILDRNWMQAREEIKIKIQSGQCGDEEVLDLVKQFDYLKGNPPRIKESK